MFFADQYYVVFPLKNLCVAVIGGFRRLAFVNTRRLFSIKFAHKLTKVIVVAEVHELLLQYLWIKDASLVAQVRLA